MTVFHEVKETANVTTYIRHGYCINDLGVGVSLFVISVLEYEAAQILSIIFRGQITIQSLSNNRTRSCFSCKEAFRMNHSKQNEDSKNVKEECVHFSENLFQ